jgi:ubiquinone/menaquinone biosynthesis C-methylase UbiE
MLSKNTVLTMVRDKLVLVTVIRFHNRIIRRISKFFHKIQFILEWRLSNPEYFEHQMDLNFMWKENRSSFPMERGVFSSFALGNDWPPKGSTLDLCSGDGFYSYYFYSKRSANVVAIDFDPSAVKFAKKNYSKARNVEFILGDIRLDIPDGPFANIVWDAAIEHFTELEIAGLIRRIKSILTPDGILSGYTIVESEDGEKHIHQHEYEFKNREDLANFLSPHFKNVQVFSTSYPERDNLYFYASDSLLPFERDNSLVLHQI